jgi:hypothetical protein
MRLYGQQGLKIWFFGPTQRDGPVGSVEGATSLPLPPGNCLEDEKYSWHSEGNDPESEQVWFQPE